MTIDINELRDAIQMFGSQAINEGDLNELLDRLETAEKERDDVAMQLAQSEQGKRKISEECDVLRDRLALESQENGALRDSIERACEERDTLQAKVEAMEKQEPVGWLFDGDFYEVRQMSLYKDNEPLQGQTALYALPGAKGE